MIKNTLSNFAVYDLITIIYLIIGIACFIWTSVGNDYVFKKIEKLCNDIGTNIKIYSIDEIAYLLKYEYKK